MNTATEAQIRFINALKADRRWEDVTAIVELVELARINWKSGDFTRQRASLLIDNLNHAPKRLDAEPVAEVEEKSLEGMHRLDGVIYKVQRAVHGSGRLYAKELVTTDTTCGGCEACDGEDLCLRTDVRFEYASGMIRRLSEATRLTLEEAKAFGALYGSCCVCAKTLTNEDSIEAGIGPVCASKF